MAVEAKTSFQEYLEKYGTKKGALIPLLQAAQEEYSYVSEEAVQSIAEVTGKYVIKVCDGTACHVNSSRELIDAIEDELGIKPDETTEDGLFTFMTVACLGCCSLAPVIMINDDTYGNLSVKKCRKIIKDYQAGKYDK